MREPRIVKGDGRQIPFSQGTIEELKYQASGRAKMAPGKALPEIFDDVSIRYAALLLAERGQ